MEAFSLLEVNEYIKRVLALNFEEPFWVECEINQVSQSRGNHYLQLIQKDEQSEQVLAMSSATIWYRQFLFIKKKLGDLTHSILQDGIKVKLKVVVNFSERYGLSLNIEDIDPSYTFGQFELNRQKIIEQLTKKDLIEKNGLLSMPQVIKKVAVISSDTAAGFKDFYHHIQSNAYGYTFDVQLFKAAMQGSNTEREVVDALREIKKQDFDIVAIIRGGGSKLDLSSFDNYNIAFEIAVSEIPVISGIGHEIDLTVTDLVAHTHLKTPTAVADWLIDHNLNFENKLLELEALILHETSEFLRIHNAELALIEERLKNIPKMRILIEGQKLIQVKQSLSQGVSFCLKSQNSMLTDIEKRIHLLKPEQVLKRGFCMLKQNGKVIARKEKFTNSESASLEFFDGTLEIKLN